MADSMPTPSSTSPAPAVSPNPNPAAGQDSAAAPNPNPNPNPATGQDPTPASADGQPKPADGQPKPAEFNWPEDWRERYANGDEKALKRLQRYASPKAALDALFAAQNKISSGELKSALKPDASPEEVAAWRVDNGIPEKPEGYELKLANGLVPRDTDKPFIDAFLKTAHEANMHPTQVNKAVEWYLTQQQEQEAILAARDEETRMRVEDELRAEMGPDYRRNLAIAAEVATSIAGPEFRDALWSARLPDGTALGNHPDLIRWLVKIARELNPIGTVVPGAGTNAVQAVESELAELRKQMGDPKSEYWKGPNAAKLQARYRDLTTALQKGRV